MRTIKSCDRTIHFDDKEVVQDYVKQKRELSSV